MGNKNGLTPQERTIILREKSLGFSKLSVFGIKEAFFGLSKQNNITLDKIEKGLVYLKIRYTEFEKKNVFLPFISAFKLENITVADSEEYSFRNFLACMFILSGSSRRDKARALFRLYDYANNDSLSKKELDYMLTNIINSIVTYSQTIYDSKSVEKNLYDLFDVKKQDAIIKRQRRFDDIKTAFLVFLLGGDVNKELDETEFSTKILDASSKLKLNILEPQEQAMKQTKEINDLQELQKEDIIASVSDKGVIDGSINNKGEAN